MRHLVEPPQRNEIVAAGAGTLGAARLLSPEMKGTLPCVRRFWTKFGKEQNVASAHWMLAMMVDLFEGVALCVLTYLTLNVLGR